MTLMTLMTLLTLFCGRYDAGPIIINCLLSDSMGATLLPAEVVRSSPGLTGTGNWDIFEIRTGSSPGNCGIFPEPGRSGNGKKISESIKNFKDFSKTFLSHSLVSNPALVKLVGPCLKLSLILKGRDHNWFDLLSIQVLSVSEHEYLFFIEILSSA